MNFYKRHLGDYAKDAGHLSMLEHGAYTLLLDRYYTTEAPIPEVDAYRITRARLKDEIAATDAVLREFFKLIDGVYTNKRADEEIGRASAQRDINRETGKRGGRPKKQTERPSEPEPNGNRIGFVSEPNDNPSQTPDSKTEAKIKHVGRQAARFVEFWAVYPNRKGKADALKAWQRKGLDAIADRIIADVRARIAGDADWLRGFVPHGSTYVNAEGWLDAIDGPKLRAVGGTGYQPLPGEI